MPLLYVNHESHSVALDWLNKHRPLRKRFLHRGTFLLTRPFFAEDDTLYLGLDPAAPDYEDHLRSYPNFQHLAVSESLFLADPTRLCYLVDRFFFQCRSFSIIIASGPTPYSSDLPKTEKMVERWEIDSPRETILKWENRRGEVPRLCNTVARQWLCRNLTIVEAVRAVKR
ncbi:hypothetical protein BO86DRAFT_390344 [Aspergillus japonicus CBS 114.51]|uniref:Uncharacterized protein n=1 Tax=Aspergillus japonicus CBS 114.51 TaxID=1448312 RepID=A0A8T8WWY9_ASPJA|nr:hypothetical protein BO86DRAFT_390344 [Aspergillus japonicus CBS 114.51]RAH80368.1 hypothetical protein BO86DRAFT_390344 [Aspergillus japonicus CBS 114.51]